MGKKIGLGLLSLFVVFAGIISFVVVKNPDMIDRIDLLVDFVGFLIVLFSIILVNRRRGVR